MSLSATVNTWYRHWIIQRNWFSQVLRKVRRFYLGTFQPKYIQNSIATTRQGECHRCGLCCELVYRCPFLGKDSENLPYCRVYGDLRPANCKNYPFDVTDSEIQQCGYSFKDAGRSVVVGSTLRTEEKELLLDRVSPSESLALSSSVVLEGKN
jgi:hypothetical protein